MSKQINQYTKERDSSTITEDDLLDLDSTEDGGSTYESAKLTIGELADYLAPPSKNTFYTGDGSIDNNRTVQTTDGNPKILKWDNISNYIKTASTELGYKIEDLNGTVRAYLSHDVAADSGKLSLSDANGEFFNAAEGNLFVGGVDTAGKFFVKGSFGTQIARFVTDSNELALEVWYDGSVQIGRTTSNPTFSIGSNYNSGSSTFFINHNGNTISSRKAFLLVNSDGSRIIDGDGDGTIRFGNDVSNATGFGAYGFNGVGSSSIFSSRPSATMHIRGSESGTSFINEDGNSGFGTTSPTAKLHIKGSGSTSATTNLMLQNSVGTNLFIARDDGNIGIGNSMPNYKLDVNGEITARSANAFRLRQSNHSALFRNDGENFYLMATEKDDIDGTWSASRPIIYNYEEDTIMFSNRNLFCSESEIGIGTITPSAKLHVVGSGSTSATTNLLLQNSVGTDILKVTDDGHIAIGTAPQSDRQFYLKKDGSDSGAVIEGVKFGIIGNAYDSDTSVGVRAATFPNLNGQGFGIRGIAQTDGAANNYGVYGTSRGGNNINVGVLGRAEQDGATPTNPNAVFAGVIGQVSNQNALITKGVVGEILTDNSAESSRNYGGYFSSLCTGANDSVNIGAFFRADGADDNYAAIFDSGTIRVNTLLSTDAVEIVGRDSNNSLTSAANIIDDLTSRIVLLEAEVMKLQNP